MKFRTILIITVTLISAASCGTGNQFTTVDDDVYFSRKENRKNVILIKDVNVDSIMKANPPKYGDPRPTNRIDDVTPNPNAWAGYPAYKARQDSLYQLYPWLSGYYVTTSPPPFDEREEARAARKERRHLNRAYRNSYGYNYYDPFYSNWNVGIGYGSGFGWNNWGYSPYVGLGFGWNNGWCNNWGYNNWGWNNWGWNNCYSPYWNYPYNGYYNGWYSPYYYSQPDNGGGSSTPAPAQRPQVAPGSSSPILENNVRPGNNNGNGQIMMSRPGDAPGSAKLEKINGRTIYIPPSGNNNVTQGYNSFRPSIDASNSQRQEMEKRPPVPESRQRRPGTDDQYQRPQDNNNIQRDNSGFNNRAPQYNAPSQSASPQMNHQAPSFSRPGSAPSSNSPSPNRGSAPGMRRP